jgi:hypothetical protein
MIAPEYGKGVFVDRNNDALAIKQLRILIGKTPI